MTSVHADVNHTDANTPMRDWRNGDRSTKRPVLTLFLFLTAFVSSMVFCSIQTVSAQSIVTLGEIKTNGTVSIASSTGRWIPAEETYPLLQDTSISTRDGTASIFLSDGSRIDLAEETVCTINGYLGDYSVKLGKGTLLFGMEPTSTLSVSTASATVLVQKRRGIVQKVSHTYAPRTLGMISENREGTEVTSISGSILVSIASFTKRIVKEGERVAISPDGVYTVYKTQAITAPADIAEEKAGEIKVLRGKSNILRAEKKLVAKRFDAVLVKDSVETEQQSRLKLLFIDDSMVTLTEKSRLYIQEYLMDREKKQGKSILKLINGRVRAITGTNRMEIHTPTAVIATRGTEIVAWVVEELLLSSHGTNNAAPSTTFEVLEEIPKDLPDTGCLKIVKTDTGVGEVIKYESREGKIFNLVEPHAGNYDATDVVTTCEQTCVAVLEDDDETKTSVVDLRNSDETVEGVQAVREGEYSCVFFLFPPVPPVFITPQIAALAAEVVALPTLAVPTALVPLAGVGTLAATDDDPASPSSPSGF